MYETLRIISKLKPKYVIWENVKNLLSKKHRHNFDNYLEKMQELGYTNFYQVLNAKDYGIPQNRERVFTISILGGGEFVFPEKKELALRLKDMLEDKVDEKYYLSDEQVKRMETTSYVSGQAENRVQKEISRTLTARDWKDPKCVYVKNATKQGYDIATEGDSINLAYPDSKTRRGRVGKEIAQTIQCNESIGVVENLRIRKLTPKECWRLMGFSDQEFEKAEKVNSNTQLYKQAGNSIVVDVLEGILKNLLKGDN